MGLSFRRITLKDLEQVKQLGLISYGQFAELLGEDWNKMQANLSNNENWEKIINGSTGFACYDASRGSATDGEILGMAFIISSGNPWDIFKAEWSYIRMVGVDPAYGGIGIAKKLTSMCIEHAKANGEKIVALHTSEFMDAARHIYESAGFKILHAIEPRFGKKYWLYTLELKS
jgi:ribosomal protein S18 acetylase RimI-like enzyme